MSSWKVLRSKNKTYIVLKTVLFFNVVMNNNAFGLMILQSNYAIEKLQFYKVCKICIYRWFQWQLFSLSTYIAYKIKIQAKLKVLYFLNYINFYINKILYNKRMHAYILVNTWMDWIVFEISGRYILQKIKVFWQHNEIRASLVQMHCCSKLCWKIKKFSK